MFSKTGLSEGTTRKSVPYTLRPPLGGLNTSSLLAAMPETDAVILDNWIAYPDRIEMRKGAANHVTGFANPVQGLHVWNGPTSRRLWATTAAGIYDATTAGAVGAPAVALTNGVTYSTLIATGAGHYLHVANGTDNLQRYDGATWTGVVAYGGLNTNTIGGLDVYRQRLFFIQKSTLLLWYLPVNSIAGAATSYDLGAIFRRGGSLIAIATWTIDGGTGPDDHLVVLSSEGEVAVFTGTDPSLAASWALKGVYYVGKPVGPFALYKYGGDLLVLVESGLFPLSRAVLSATLDRSSSVSSKVEQGLIDLIASYGANNGWMMLNIPHIPALLVNVPGYPGGLQFVMHSKSRAWSTFSGWVANCFALMNKTVYFGGSTFVATALEGASDFSANITATMLQAYSNFRQPRDKHIKMMRPTFQANGAFNYTLGFASNFNGLQTENLVALSAGAASLWGTATWGTSLWSSSDVTTRQWRGVTDYPGTHKACFCKVTSQTARASLQAIDLLITPQGNF